MEPEKVLNIPCFQLQSSNKQANKQQFYYRGENEEKNSTTTYFIAIKNAEEPFNHYLLISASQVAKRLH